MKLEHIITIKYICYIMETKMDKRIIVLLAIIAILAVALAYCMLTFNHDKGNAIANNTTAKNTTLNNTTVKNDTVTQASTNSESGKYGYCAICGRALSASEASNEYTQGKVCMDCAKNPYYQSGEGARYANQKLFEAYPDEYEWMYEDTSNVKYEQTYDYNNGGDPEETEY